MAKTVRKQAQTGPVPKSTRQRFTADRRQQLLELINGGQSVAAARAAVGVSDATIRSWLARADTDQDDLAAAEFASDYRAAVALPRGRSLRPDQLAKAERQGNLSADDLVAMLEERARAGSEGAMKVLLARLDAKAKEEPAKPVDNSRGRQILDELAALRESGRHRNTGQL